MNAALLQNCHLKNEASVALNPLVSLCLSRVVAETAGRTDSYRRTDQVQPSLRMRAEG